MRAAVGLATFSIRWANHDASMCHHPIACHTRFNVGLAPSLTVHASLLNRFMLALGLTTYQEHRGERHCYERDQSYR